MPAIARADASAGASFQGVSWSTTSTACPNFRQWTNRVSPSLPDTSLGAMMHLEVWDGEESFSREFKLEAVKLVANAA